MTYRSAKKVYFMVVSAVTVSAFMIICTLGQAVRRKKVETRLAAAAIEQWCSAVIRKSHICS